MGEPSPTDLVRLAERARTRCAKALAMLSPFPWIIYRGGSTRPTKEQA